MCYYDEMYNPMDMMDEDEYYFHQQEAINEEWEWFEHERKLNEKRKKVNAESLGNIEPKTIEK